MYRHPRRPLELLPQLADEDVDRPVAVDHRVAPHALVDLLPLQHLPLGVGQQLDELELAPREIDRPATRERLELVGADLDLADHDRAPDAPRRAYDAGAASMPRSSSGDTLGDPVVAPMRRPSNRWATRTVGETTTAEMRKQVQSYRGAPTPGRDREVRTRRSGAGHHRVERTASEEPCCSASPSGVRTEGTRCRRHDRDPGRVRRRRHVAPSIGVTDEDRAARQRNTMHRPLKREASRPHLGNRDL